MAMSRSQQQNVPEVMQMIDENSETQDNPQYMTWEEIIEVADTSEEEAAEATAQEPDVDEDVEDGENSQENAEDGKNWKQQNGVTHHIRFTFTNHTWLVHVGGGVSVCMGWVTIWKKDRDEKQSSGIKTRESACCKRVYGMGHNLEERPGWETVKWNQDPGICV